MMLHQKTLVLGNGASAFRHNTSTNDSSCQREQIMFHKQLRQQTIKIKGHHIGKQYQTNKIKHVTNFVKTILEEKYFYKYGRKTLKIKFTQRIPNSQSYCGQLHYLGHTRSGVPKLPPVSHCEHLYGLSGVFAAAACLLNSHSCLAHSAQV